MQRNESKELKKDFIDKKEQQQTSDVYVREAQVPTTSHHSCPQSLLEEQSKDSNLYISNSVSQQQSHRHHSIPRTILPAHVRNNPKLHIQQQIPVHLSTASYSTFIPVHLSTASYSTFIPVHLSTASYSTFIPVHEAVASSSKQTPDMQPLDLSFKRKPDKQSIVSFLSHSFDETCEEHDEKVEKKKFAAEIKQRRIDSGLSQKDLAKEINEISKRSDFTCTPLHISRFEIGTLTCGIMTELEPLLETWIENNKERSIPVDVELIGKVKQRRSELGLLQPELAKEINAINKFDNFNCTIKDISNFENEHWTKRIKLYLKPLLQEWIENNKER